MKESRVRSRQHSRNWAGSLSYEKDASAHFGSGAVESASGFHYSFACLTPSVLVTWFPSIERERQTCVTRKQAFTTMISSHIEVSLKMVDLFSFMYVLGMCCYA